MWFDVSLEEGGGSLRTVTAVTHKSSLMLSSGIKFPIYLDVWVINQQLKLNGKFGNRMLINICEREVNVKGRIQIWLKPFSCSLLKCKNLE